MLKRLIEVALPLKEVSEQSAREKSIRHGHISTLHIWWARRPLAACRAVVFSSLIPDPDDPDCPESFRNLVMDLLGRNEFQPKNGDGSAVADTPRKRCLELIKHLVRWENSNNAEYIEPARKLIVAANKVLHPNAEGNAPKVLDPFAGGGAIPLEALRLGCEAHAIDLNPVAYLIELCTLVYAQTYGHPDSRPVPDYIKRLIAHNQTKKKAKGKDRPLFDRPENAIEPIAGEIIPDVEITGAEYRKNPLAADMKYWGAWVLSKAGQQMRGLFPNEPDGSEPVAYLWARTVCCPNPSCRTTVPLIRHLWLCKKTHKTVALKLHSAPDTRECWFSVVEDQHVDFNPDEGTMRDGKALCPICNTTISGEQLRCESKAGRIGHKLTAVVSVTPSQAGKKYRSATQIDEQVFLKACQQLEVLIANSQSTIVPDEPRDITESCG